MLIRARLTDVLGRSGRPEDAAPGWYQIKNADGENAEIMIFDEIGYFGVSAEQFVNELGRISASTITVKINSPGGDVFDGLAIYNALRGHASKVVTQVEGLAASAASFIAMAGDEIAMHESSFMMVHHPWTFALGNAKDLRAVADILEKIGGSLVDIYAKKSGLPVEDVDKMLTDETWLTAAEARDLSLIDRVLDDNADTPAKAQAFDLSIFSLDKMPAALRDALPQHSATAQAAPAGGDVDPDQLLAFRMRARLKLAEHHDSTAR